MEKLAIMGGQPAVPYKLPNWNDATGRSIAQEERDLVLEVLESGRLGTVSGKKNKEFQRLWAEKCDVDTAVAVNSGTSAVHTALVYAAIGAGDEVMVPAITDMGTVIGILLQNGIPVFVDVDPVTQNIDLADMESKITPRTKAVIVVHMFGLPCDMDPLMDIAKKHDIIVIEDCCQAHFSTYKGRLVGTIGDIGCFSFQQTKHITTGEGGMVITNRDSRFGRVLQQCSDKGWPRDKYRDHLFLAPNYHMTDLQAAVGIAQLGKIDAMLDARRKSAKVLNDILNATDGAIAPPEPEGYKHTYFGYQFYIDPQKFTVGRDTIIDGLNAEGLDIVTSYLEKPLYRFEFLENHIMYNKTKCPTKCTYYDGEMDYAKVNCEKAEYACTTGLYMQWNERITEENAADIGRAISKVLTYYHK